MTKPTMSNTPDHDPAAEMLTDTTSPDPDLVATKAAPDLICWLLAAVPPNSRGGVNVARCAQILGVVPSTVYRWLKTAEDRAFEPEARTLLERYAILRGHGGILWPTIDPATASRHAAYLAEARAGLANVERNPDAYTTWRPANTPAEVFTYHHPKAKVYGVAYATTETNRRRILGGGATIVESRHVPSLLHAKALKYAVLEQAGDARCIAPRELIGAGRTEVWRQRAGEIAL